MSDFNKEVFGYEMPDDIPQEVEGTGFEYYKHPAGLYICFCGKLNFKYVGPDKKTCDAEAPGAVLSHAILPAWIHQYHGTTTKPVTEEIISLKTLDLPNRQLAECYYPIRVSFLKEEQWKNKNLFGGWFIQGNSHLNIIGNDPSKPNVIKTNFKAFPAYYGVGMRFTLAMSDKGNTYIDGKKDAIGLMLDKRIPTNLMLEFEKKVESKLAAERDEREANKNRPNQEEPPETNFNELAGEEESNDLGDFLK